MGYKPTILLIVVMLIVAAVPAFAQDEPIYTEDKIAVIYYEDRSPDQLAAQLLFRNICLEPVLLLNPELDILNIAYGTQIRVPKNEPCYERPHENGYDLPPRLKYYEDGEWLDEPYYSDETRYIWGSKTTLDSIARQYRICPADLLVNNILLHDYERYHEFTVPGFTFDVFIPKDDLPLCHFPEALLQTVPDEKYVEFGTTVAEFDTDYSVALYNVCVEEIERIGQAFYTGNHAQNWRLRFSVDAPPCYNEDGQRLRYYNLEGERLDEPVYTDWVVERANPGLTLATIAQRHDVCLIDLVRANHFADMPMNKDMEVLIPPARPCPTDIEAQLVIYETLSDISKEINICPTELLPLNPHLIINQDQTDANFSHEPFYYRQNPKHQNHTGHWIIVPTDADPCYRSYEPELGQTIYDIERALNICHEEFLYQGNWSVVQRFIAEHQLVPIYTRLDVLPCYNEDEHRLIYPTYRPTNPNVFPRHLPIEPPEHDGYADMRLHTFQTGETVYSISQQYNVCVHELLAINARLIGSRPAGLMVFIPDTRPCYDKASGLPLIYEDEIGNPLPERRVAEHLIYYGSQPHGRVSYYYNVCQNRIENANRAKLDREASYLGWIIPTDRPPCYDEKGEVIEYVCYTQPIDFTVDYAQVDKVINLDVNGSHCYDLAHPETVIWHQNTPYKVIFYKDTLLQSRAFTEWCYGVSREAIDHINDQSAILEMLPYHARAIPIPTRNCYIDQPDMLDDYTTVHFVEAGETLSRIAREYDLLSQWIAEANDISADNMIWQGQLLIIPDGLRLRPLIAVIAGGVGLIALVLLSYRRRTRTYTRKKRKRHKVL